MPLTEPPALPAAALAVIASRLGLDRSELDQDVLGVEYAFAAARIASAWTCIGDPAALTYPDSTFFDGAAALIVAARLFGPLTTGAGGIIVKTQNADGDAVTYAPPLTANPEKWLTEAEGFVQQVSCVKASLAASASAFNFFRAGNDQRLHRPCGAGWGIGVGILGLLDYGVYPLLYGDGEAYYRGSCYGNGYYYGG